MYCEVLSQIKGNSINDFVSSKFLISVVGGPSKYRTRAPEIQPTPLRPLKLHRHTKRVVGLWMINQKECGSYNEFRLLSESTERNSLQIRPGQWMPLQDSKRVTRIEVGMSGFYFQHMWKLPFLASAPRSILGLTQLPTLWVTGANNWHLTSNWRHGQ